MKLKTARLIIFQPNLESGWFYYISPVYPGKNISVPALHSATIDSDPEPAYNGNKNNASASLYCKTREEVLEVSSQKSNI